jgi:hypothetical protein
VSKSSSTAIPPPSPYPAPTLSDRFPRIQADFVLGVPGDLVPIGHVPFCLPDDLRYHGP